MPRERATFARALVVIGWMLVVGAGFVWTLTHGGDKPALAAAPAQWPGGTKLSLDPVVPTLVMFAHPRCPCTRASLHELQWIVDHSRGNVHAYVVFARPHGATPDWEKTPLRAAAGTMAGVTVVDDEGDEEAHRFTATSSGHVVIYAPSGALRFAGGITGERGHEGESSGRTAALAELTGTAAPSQLVGYVFGCSLDTPRGKQ